MKKILIIISLIISILLLNTTKNFAQSSPEELMTPFFQLFEEDIDKAVDYLFSTNSMIDPNLPAIKNIKDQLDTSRRLLGNYYGFEIANKYYAGESYAKYIYLLKYERQPLKLVITLYKPNNKWKVQNLNFQDDIDSELNQIK